MLSPAYAPLKTEVTTDPLGRGYAAMTDAQVSADLNTAYRTRVLPQVPLNSLLIWGGQGPLQKLQDYANTVSNNAGLRASCLAALQVLSGAAPYLDLSDSRITTLLTSLVSGGVLSSTDQSNLLALQDQPLTRAVEVWGIAVQTPDITAVRTMQ